MQSLNRKLNKKNLHIQRLKTDIAALQRQVEELTAENVKLRVTLQISDADAPAGSEALSSPNVIIPTGRCEIV